MLITPIRFKYLISVFVLLVVSGCAQNINTLLNDKQNSVSFYLKYDFYTYDYERLINHKRNEPLALLFPPIPGTLFGNPEKQFLTISKARDDGYFRLTLPKSLNHIAKPLSTKGLDITPYDSTILRIGTFHAYPSNGDQLGGGGFYNSKTKDFYILVFFSKPASITGSLKIRNKIYEHDIRAKQSGWHWIKVKKGEGNRHSLTIDNTDQENIIFTVLQRSKALRI